MNKEQEKNLIYGALAELAETGKNPEIYFSRERILRYLKESLAQEGITGIFRGKGYAGSSNKKVSVRDKLPRVNTLELNLGELVEEDRAKVVLADVGAYSPYKLYRAKK